MEKVDSKSRKMFITDSIYKNLTSLPLIQQKEKIIANESTNSGVPDYCTNPGGMISNCWCMCHMSRHIHWYYYYDIVVSLTQTTLGPAIINIILGDPKSIPILSGVLWYQHSAISAWHSCGWRVEEDGGYYGWRVVGGGGRRWHRQQYSNQRVYLWLLYWSCLGRLNTITSFTLCSQSGGAGSRECEVELSRVCHDVTRRSVTEMETVTRAGHWTPAHCATAIVDSSSLQQICCG